MISQPLNSRRIMIQQIKSQLLLVILKNTIFILRELFFLGIYYICSILYPHFSTLFFRSYSAAKFYLTSKSRPTRSSSACPPLSKSPTINKPQQSTKASIYARKSLNFWIIIELPSYHSIGPHSNIIYYLFIVEY